MNKSRNNFPRYFVASLILLICAQAAYSQSYCGLERFSGMNYTLGIDIGNGSMIIDWENLKISGIKFVYIKKSYGDSATRKIIYRYVKAESNCIKDSVLVNHGHYVNYRVVWEAAKCHDVTRGVYHYWMNNKSAESQAYEFLKGIDPVEFSSNSVLPPVLDLEDTTSRTAELDDNIMKWISIVESTLHRKVIIYAGPKSLWNAYESGSAKLAPKTIDELVKHDLWTVQLKDGITEPNTLAWSTWKFWQYCHDFGTVFNSGDIDLNVFNGTFDELISYNEKNLKK